jgi:DNA-directed RNA polymerase specialized sigma24 family protein
MMIESPDQQGLDDFAALYVGHYEQLLRLAVLLVGDMAAAEDVVQEAFIRVHRTIESGTSTGTAGLTPPRSCPWATPGRPPASCSWST